MIPLLFPFQMIRPVAIEITTGLKGANPQYSFCPFESPAGSGEIHSIFNEMPACTLEYSSGNRKTLLEEDVIVEQSVIFFKVFGTLHHCLALLGP